MDSIHGSISAGVTLFLRENSIFARFSWRFRLIDGLNADFLLAYTHRNTDKYPNTSEYLSTRKVSSTARWELEKIYSEKIANTRQTMPTDENEMENEHETAQDRRDIREEAEEAAAAATAQL